MTKKRVGIITFHASHNYGSMLQAYALQQVVIEMGCDCEIINFRTKRQKDFYKPDFLKGSFAGKIKRTLLYAPFVWPVLMKHRKFENFLNKNYRLSPYEYATLEELEQANLDYDICISGSDQVWNTCCFDFDWAYLLPFADKAKRIAYAPSMGTTPSGAIGQGKKEHMKELLSGYDYISVRERQTQEQVCQLIHTDCVVTLDPTLLLDSEYWNKMVGNKPLIKGDYIFLYSPWFDESVNAEAELLSKKLNIPIVVSLFYDSWQRNYSLMCRGFRFHLATGPIEFLNLCKFATFTIGKSFHLVVFSILLQTHFYAVDGMNDSRISDLLTLTGLSSRNIDTHEQKDLTLKSMNFVDALCSIDKARQYSLEWLRKKLS